MKTAYRQIRFRADTRRLIEAANVVIEEWERQGYRLTLRQLFFALVTKSEIENSEREYKRLGELMADARYGGMVDWNALEDRTRDLEQVRTFIAPSLAVARLATTYRRNPWSKQRHAPECWVSKQALDEIVGVAAGHYRCPYLACRGYLSATEMHDAARRLMTRIDLGQEPVILFLGDHTPSGIDMARDIDRRLTEFLRYHQYPKVEVRRIALNLDQIKAGGYPPAPPKKADTRSADYIKRFGSRAWELDALPPKDLHDLIVARIREYIDWDAWQAVLLQERHECRQIEAVAEDWEQAAFALAIDEYDPAKEPLADDVERIRHDFEIP